MCMPINCVITEELLSECEGTRDAAHTAWSCQTDDWKITNKQLWHKCNDCNYRDHFVWHVRASVCDDDIKNICQFTITQENATVPWTEKPTITNRVTDLKHFCRFVFTVKTTNPPVHVKKTNSLYLTVSTLPSGCIVYFCGNLHFH